MTSNLPQPMKHRWIVPTILILTASTAALPSVFAASYSIPWFKIAGGGGTSAGGSYSLSGTLGQAEGSTALRGGPFSLAGGYWTGIILIQSPEAPTLSISQVNPDGVIVCWPEPSTGWTLQESADLNANSWITSLRTPSVREGNRCVLITSPLKQLFLRLVKP